MSVSDELVLWLQERGYAQTSITKIARDIVTMTQHGPVPPSSTSTSRRRDFRWAWQLWDEFCKETRRRNKLAEPPEPPKMRRRTPRRQKPALSIPETEWSRLEQLVYADPSPAARVLEVMMATGLRVGDVLRTRMAALDEGLAHGEVIQLEVKTGKLALFPLVRKPWARLRKTLSSLRADQRVCEGVAKNGVDWSANGAPYQAVRRKLQSLAFEAGTHTRMHTHRLRRSVGMQMLRAGVPLEHVQRVFGQEDKATTERYLDEAAVDIAARALAQRKRPPPI